jgi:hypothetical protein
MVPLQVTRFRIYSLNSIFSACDMLCVGGAQGEGEMNDGICGELPRERRWLVIGGSFSLTSGLNCEAPIRHLNPTRSPSPPSPHQSTYNSIPNIHTTTTYNASQTARPCLSRPSNHHTLYTCTFKQVIKRHQCTRHPPGHIQQICHQDTTARKASRHIHGILSCRGRASIPLRRPGRKLCTCNPKFKPNSSPQSPPMDLKTTRWSKSLVSDIIANTPSSPSMPSSPASAQLLANSSSQPRYASRQTLKTRPNSRTFRTNAHLRILCLDHYCCTFSASTSSTERVYLAHRVFMSRKWDC